MRLCIVFVICVFVVVYFVVVFLLKLNEFVSCGCCFIFLVLILFVLFVSGCIFSMRFSCWV